MTHKGPKKLEGIFWKNQIKREVVFVEKREDASHVIQIINYGSTETKDLVDHIKQEVIEEHNSFDSLPDNISFIEYNDDNT